MGFTQLVHGLDGQFLLTKISLLKFFVCNWHLSSVVKNPNNGKIPFCFDLAQWDAKNMLR